MGDILSKPIINDEEILIDDLSLKPIKRCFSLQEEKNKELILIWLDEKSGDDTLDTLRTKTLLRQINNDHCLFFNQINPFLNQIEILKNKNMKILVVISGSFAQIILPKIHDIISTIIIFCGNYNKYSELNSKYINVTDVCTDHETLKNCIEREISSLKLNLFEKQTYKTIRTLTSSENILGNGDAYFSYILFIELLKQMPQTKQMKEIMLNKCKDYYRRDKQELEKINNFHLYYNSEKAIDWYIEDCFVYHLINRAFRTEDISLWYLFRFYIVDLCKQLEKIHKEQNIQHNLILYRGEAHLPKKEFENLKTNIGGLISTNGFFSTSQQIDIAQVFISDAKDTDEFKVVIFQITVHTSQLKNIIFVDIDKYTGKIGENEVLFNIGSVFRIENVEYDNDMEVWKIEMNATDEDIYQIEYRFDIMREKFEKGNINLLFGRLLLDMKQYAKVESYFRMMLSILPREHEDLASVYDHIGDLNMRITNWNEAYTSFCIALNIKKTRLRSNHPSFAVTFNGIGNYYKAIDNISQAYSYYLKALECNNDEYNKIIAKLNIANIHMINQEFDNALNLCIEIRDILHRIKSYSQIEIIYCQGFIGDIYLAKKNYQYAEDFYLLAFELSRRFLFPDDHCQIRCIKALVNLYQEQGNERQAMLFCKEQLSFQYIHLEEDDTSIAYLLMKLGDLHTNDDLEKLQIYKRALHILEKKVHQEYFITSICLMNLAKCCLYWNEQEKALTYYLRALEIQNKIYPANHSKIIETQRLIQSME
ncbi:unnamed protein product [Adineta steineri]|uniref:ADP ribosyltransferase domain-containing protein n=1 Tax=Adineta steineri TaxID=433720 RepID=A0A816BQ24_9BILA|nr:unnamed protein product [Adineta steineri]CAF1611975.1 unnamed protein product [Adineta steineri]